MGGYTGSAYEKCEPIKVNDQPFCQSDSDCPIFQACIGNKCLDPCYSQSTCAFGAECQVINHRATCSCLVGYAGDGFNGCIKLECQNNRECQDDSICHQNRCVDACTVSRPCGSNAECRSQDNKGFCFCLPGYLGD